VLNILQYSKCIGDARVLHVYTTVYTFSVHVYQIKVVTQFIVR